MSTILDALRKAQEETGDKRQPPVVEHPAATEAVTPSPRARRRIGWPVAVVGILGLASAGGLAFGDRIAALLGNGADGDAPAASADVQVAARRDDAPVAPAAPDVKQRPAEPAAAAPKMRRGKPRAEGKAPASDEAVVRAQGQGAAPDAGAAAAPAAVPTPYGQLHVFGAGERPAGNKPTDADRLARLQQLRDKMLKARQEAAARGPQAEAPAAPAQIFVPPPREAAPAQAEAAAPKTDASAVPASNEAARGATGAPAAIAPPAEPVHDAPVEVARADMPPPADRPSDQPVAVEPAEPAVGVSVTNAHAEAAEAEVQDPDIPPPHQAPAAAPEPPTTVAAVAPAQPAPAAAARAAAAAPQVLRRAPGGAPQVAINILQWSAEPGRRFAFVSVDGGNMTQVREGDHIAGLTIKHIHQQMIEFGFNDSTFLLRAN